MNVSRARLQQHFGAAAAQYDVYAHRQQAECDWVLGRAYGLFAPGAKLVDIGCGTGYFAAQAQQQKMDWSILGLDLALAMCQRAQAHCGVIAGDAAQLPLADASLDGAVSVLCYQWVENKTAAFGELWRVLKPGGRAVISLLGGATLKELRDCAAQAGVALQLLPMGEFSTYSSQLKTAGFKLLHASPVPVLEYEAEVTALLDSMRRIGAGNNFEGESRGLLGRQGWQRLLDAYEQKRTTQGLPVTWEYQRFEVQKP